MRSTSSFGWVALTAVVLLVPAFASPGPSAPAPSASSGHAPAALTAVPAASAVPAVPGATPRWINLTQLENGTAPPPGYEGTMAYDPTDVEWVYFGGCTTSECPSNQTWVYAHGGWTNLTDFGPAPPARREAAMDFDANAGGVLLFGGVTANGSALNDTWLFRGGAWASMNYLGPAPPARFAANLVFDPQASANGSLLFGGCIPTFGAFCLNDTWRWQPGAGWTDVGATTGVPPVRGFAEMAYDAADGYVVLFGGIGNCLSTFCYYNDTWEYYSNTWWPVHPSGGSPAGRYSAALTSDPTVGGVLLFGGYNATYSLGLNDTWTFSHGAWTQLTAVGGPAVRYAAAVPVDSGGTVPLLFGGEVTSTGTYVADTWVFEAPLAVQVSGPTAVGDEVNQTVPVSVSVTGGSAPYSVSVDFGDGSGAAANGSQNTFSFPHAYGRTGMVSLLATVTDGVGLTLNQTASGLITPGPSVGISPGSPAGDVGLPVAFAAVTGAGSPGLTTFGWSFGEGANTTGANTTHAFSAAGTFPVELQATDGAGVSTSAHLSFSVNPVPTAALTVGAGTREAGGPIALQGGVNGGTAPYHYAWLLGDGATASGPDPSHVYATAGQYTVQLWVNDSLGASAHATGSVSVTAAPVGSPGPAAASSGIPTWYWGALAGIVIATVAGAWILLRRRR